MTRLNIKIFCPCTVFFFFNLASKVTNKSLHFALSTFYAASQLFENKKVVTQVYLWQPQMWCAGFFTTDLTSTKSVVSQFESAYDDSFPSPRENKGGRAYLLALLSVMFRRCKQNRYKLLKTILCQEFTPKTNRWFLKTEKII